MKRSELKDLIKPIVKECIKESIFEDGVLSNIIAEVAKGLQGTMIQEARTAPRQQTKQTDVIADIRKERSLEIEQARKKAIEEINREAFRGVNIFEGTKPAAPEPKGPTASGPGAALSGIAPDDPGVDISGILALGGNAWSALMK